MLLADRILTIDAYAIVVDKPAGLPVDAPRDGGTSVESHLDMMRFGFARRPQPVHRLDRDTSGCLILARNERIHRKLSAAFEAGMVSKTYHAIIDGVPADEAGLIDLPLRKVSSARDGWRIEAHRSGKAARTHWTVERVIDGRALIRFQPETGRTHQLRVHAATGLGMPIVGDPVYGVADGVPMRLHATDISAPRGDGVIAAHAPLPDRFGAFA